MKVKIKQPKMLAKFQIQHLPTDLENLNITPTKQTQTHNHPNSDGYNIVTVDAVSSNVDENIQPENIKKDIDILGVVGTLTQPTGTISITENGTDIDVSSYATANVNVSGGGGADLNDYFTGIIRSADGSAEGYSFTLKRIPSDTVVSGTSLEGAFRSCSALVEVPLLDTSQVTSMSNCFNACSSLTTIPQFNTARVTTMQRAFYKCTSLTTLPVLSTAKITNMDLAFYNCPNLSNDSLNNILQMCINVYKSYPSASKKLSSIGLSSEQATICEGLSNYQDFLNAGWITGY